MSRRSCSSATRRRCPCRRLGLIEGGKPQRFDTPGQRGQLGWSRRSDRLIGMGGGLTKRLLELAKRRSHPANERCGPQGRRHDGRADRRPEQQPSIVVDPSKLGCFVSSARSRLRFRSGPSDRPSRSRAAYALLEQRWLSARLLRSDPQETFPLRMVRSDVRQQSLERRIERDHYCDPLARHLRLGPSRWTRRSGRHVFCPWTPDSHQLRRRAARPTGRLGASPPRAARRRSWRTHPWHGRLRSRVRSALPAGRSAEWPSPPR